MNTHLETVTDVLRTIGDAVEPRGFVGIAARMGLDARAVSTWNANGVFPSKYFCWMQREITKLGYSAPPELWGMRLLDEPPEARATRAAVGGDG